EAWMKGKTRIIVCTNAFGMGIDKPEVRVVIHTSLPESLEAYFQEAGRAGRDGLRSYAVLLYSPTDGDQLRHFVQTAYPSLDKIRQVYRALGSHTQLAVGAGLGESFDFDLQHFCATYRLDQAECHHVLRILELEGWISVSEAAYSPARVYITADREQLYDFQLRHRQGDIVVKSLLRGYGGIQQDFVVISEATLAQYAKLSLDTFRATLQLAQQEQVLLYEPHKDKPQLTFTRERCAAENLTIDLEKFNFRKTRAILRTDQAIRYAEMRRCRSQLLLAYFDEPDAAACGICDVCTGRNRSDLPSQVVESYQRKIRDVLLAEPLNTAELLSAFAPKRHDQVMQVMNYLSDEGYIQEDEKGKWTLKK
ncbi:MAG TPA: helicase-related protein, partial [Saprospiraceae bacterium]|nr:helicase-related protein [Saprospiraceae bacterium]